MKQQKIIKRSGKLTIVKNYNSEEDSVRIEIKDSNSNKKILVANISKGDFADAIFGLGEREIEYRKYNISVDSDYS
jgi:hypothetical protein